MVDEILDNLRVAVIGLGEAGGAIAADLVAAGVRVLGWDPAATRYRTECSRRGAPRRRSPGRKPC